MSRTDLDRLRDILESIDAIVRARAIEQRYPTDQEVAQVALDAIVERIFVIGEATQGLSGQARALRPEVPWNDVIRMRDLIAHHYYKLDAQIVRATVERPLAVLEDACRALTNELAQLSAGSAGGATTTGPP